MNYGSTFKRRSLWVPHIFKTFENWCVTQFIIPFSTKPFMSESSRSIEMLCAILYHLFNLKNVKNTNGGVILLVSLFHGCFSRFSHCANCTKSRKVSNIVKRRAHKKVQSFKVEVEHFHFFISPAQIWDQWQKRNWIHYIIDKCLSLSLDKIKRN